MRRLLFVLIATVLLAGGCRVPWLALVSQDATGGPADDLSSSPAMSADGRFVAFASDAEDLVPGDTNGLTDVFVRDLQTGTTEVVSVGIGGVPADGRSVRPSISADGQRVAFTSRATNLAPDVPGRDDVYVRDRAAGTTVSASFSFTSPEGSGVGNPAISGDGSKVWFGGGAAFGGQIFRAMLVYDVTTGALSGAPTPQNYLVPSVSHGSVSYDGRYAAIAGQSLPQPEIDAFVYRADRVAGTLHPMTELDGLTPANGCFSPAISGDGARMAFVCGNDQLVPGGSTGNQVYLYDAVTGGVTQQSVDPAGGHADLASGEPELNADGSLVAFSSHATNLVAGDTNGTSDIFVRDVVAGSTWRVSLGQTQATGSSSQPALGGELISFTYTGEDLVPGGAPGDADVVARAIRIPEIHTVSPATLAAGATQVLSVTGAHFQPDTTATIAGGTGVTVDSVTYFSPTQVEVTVTAAPDAAAGKRTLVVEVPGPGAGVGGRTGSMAYCPCLTVP